METKARCMTCDDPIEVTGVCVKCADIRAADRSVDPDYDPDYAWWDRQYAWSDPEE